MAAVQAAQMLVYFELQKRFMRWRKETGISSYKVPSFSLLLTVFLRQSPSTSRTFSEGTLETRKGQNKYFGEN